MREETALELAIGLRQLPSRARALRNAPLPRDVNALLSIVAGEKQALADAARMTGLSEGTVSEAAGFYVEQILLHPDADCYRALGAHSDATTDQLRRNMALLLRWLHPDREVNSARTIYVARVTSAWNSIKTVERRLAYDSAHKSAAGNKSTHRTPGAGNGQVPPRPATTRVPGTGSRRSRSRRRGRLWRLLGRWLRQGRS